MILKHYTKTRAAKLMRLQIDDITYPVNIKIYWLNSLTVQNKPELINRQIHCHTFFEAHFILDGNSVYQDENGQRFSLSAGEGILFAPGVNHIVEELSPDMIRFSLAFLPEKNTFLEEALSEKEVQFFRVSDRLTDCLDVILYEVDQKSILSAAMIQHRIMEMINEILRTIGRDLHTKDTGNHDAEDLIIRKAKQYISDNRGKMLTCKEVADHCHFHVKYLSTIFAEQTGQPLLEYIHDEKIKYAEVLLHDETLTLKQVSQGLGFANEYYFNTFFKRRNGITPGQFRKLSGQ